MPKREDEYWASQKENLRYCSKHNRYYDVKLGCQLCYLDELNLKWKSKETPELHPCPKCKEVSLFWNEYHGVYECLNPKCKNLFTRDLKVAVGRTNGQQNQPRGLCPFCGSPNISLIESIWTCKECEKTFPSPSYGPGRNCGREDRSLGETTQEESSAEERVREHTRIHTSLSGGGRAWFGGEYFDPKSRRWKKPRVSFSVRKFFLVLLVIACLVAAAYTGYLLATGRTDAVVGAIILVVDIGVLIWNIAVLRSYRVRLGSVFTIFLSTALVASTVCAFAGVAPFSQVKDEIISHFTREEEKPPQELQQETYWVATLSNEEYMKLWTIESWEGSGSREINFKATKAPWVVNYGRTSTTSQITSRLRVVICDRYGGFLYLWDSEADYGPLKGATCIVVDETGDYIIEIDATGVEWWLKVGVED